ncbi:hypothetical protein B4U80_02601 [Leptotrombidium deliense]|uniref:Uncharacterized protein n=1 Tax=Leptotrombidium deliense TaxID=299467 RepID=A0A443SWC5_9ACAR|nr:hypothetical protein B4U80_02601 [Leptotrombidium deliense]
MSRIQMSLFFIAFLCELSLRTANAEKTKNVITTKRSNFSGRVNETVKDASIRMIKKQRFDGYGGGFGYDDLFYGKSELYWIIPLVFVLGIGALLLPIISIFMTSMITSGTLTLSAGRRKRDLNSKEQILSESITSFIKIVVNALKKYD